MAGPQRGGPDHLEEAKNGRRILGVLPQRLFLVLICELVGCSAVRLGIGGGKHDGDHFGVCLRHACIVVCGWFPKEFPASDFGFVLEGSSDCEDRLV